eukprot:tig00020746_g13672.t1
MEQLHDAINSCFRAEIELLTEYGADVQSFLGDGLLAIWPVEPYAHAEADGTTPLVGAAAAEDGDAEADRSEHGSGRLAAALSLRAAAAVECALRIQERFAAGVAGGMRLRIALSAGPLRLHVGGLGPGPGLKPSDADADPYLGPDRARGAQGQGQGRPASSSFLWGEPEGDARRAPGAPGPRSNANAHVPGRMVFFAEGAAVTEAGEALGEIAPGFRPFDFLI